MATSPIGADALLESLKQLGVKSLFSYPGGAVLPIYDRLSEYDLKRVLVRHEQGAGFAAQGFSRSTDEVGVCLATSGPGATNLVTAIADAYMDNIPLLAITGNVFTHLIGSDAFQETDIMGICEPIVKHSFFLTQADDIADTIATALWLAKSGRPGPVLVDITKTAQSDPVCDEIWKRVKQGKFSRKTFLGHQPDPSPLPESLQAGADFLQNAERPVAIIGHGAILGNAQKQVQDFLEKTKIPYTWTVHGISATDQTSPRALGMLGMHGTAAANYATHHADVVLGIGIRFDDRITGNLKEFKSNTKFVHLDIDKAEFGKIVSGVSIQGSLSKTLPEWQKKLTHIPSWAPWQKTLEGVVHKHPLPSEPKGDRLTEITVLDSIFAKIADDAVVTVDVGQHQMWASQRFPGRPQQRLLASGGLGTMGFSLPAALGASFAGRETWSISGDGGFQMNMQELVTIKQEQAPVKIVILNNSFLGMVRQWQELFYDKNYVDTPLENPDFAKLGEACGIESFVVDSVDQVEAATKRLKDAKGPILCEFRVEKEANVFPMVPAGQSLGKTMVNENTYI